MPDSAVLSVMEKKKMDKACSVYICHIVSSQGTF